MTSVEYGIIAAFVGIAAIGGFIAIRNAGSDNFEQTTAGTGVCVGSGCNAYGTLPIANVPGLGAAPVLSAISPPTGPTSGGGTLSLTGTGFAVGATVTMGGSTCSLATVSSSTSMTCTVPPGSGSVNVSVINTDGQSSNSQTYTYTASASAPTLAVISPTGGPVAGGGTLTLTGTNFVSGATVSVGPSACTPVIFVSSTSLTCTTPGGTGNALVFVRNPDGQTSGTLTYAYAAAAPQVSAVNPASGPAAGGTTVTITGSGFVSGATVTFGGTACPSVTFTSATSMSCVAPAKTAGTHAVVVTNPDTQASNADVTFTYVASPTVTAVSPTGGPLAGGTTITVTGTGFVSGATVKVGGTNCTSVTFSSATSMTCVTPAKTAGAQALVVTNPDTQASNADVTFTYRPAPTISNSSGVSPTSGPPAGDTSITITGTGFLSGATVAIGGNACTSVTVVSATSITCRTPAGTSGQRVVTVTNPDGQSGSLNNGFRYT